MMAGIEFSTGLAGAANRTELSWRMRTQKMTRDENAAESSDVAGQHETVAPRTGHLL